jgi:hypothetical protein
MPDDIRPEDKIAHAEEIRDAALDNAVNEAVRRDIAEAQAVDARIAANQAIRQADEMAAEKQVLRHELGYERVANSNNTFGFYLTLAVLLAGILVGGFYLYYRSQNPDTLVVNAASPSAPAPVIVTPAQPATTVPPPITVHTPPPVVNVTPPSQPAPEVNVKVTPPDSNTSSDSNSGADNKTDSNTNNTDSGSSPSGSGG